MNERSRSTVEIPEAAYKRSELLSANSKSSTPYFQNPNVPTPFQDPTNQRIT